MIKTILIAIAVSLVCNLALIFGLSHERFLKKKYQNLYFEALQSNLNKEKK